MEVGLGVWKEKNCVDGVYDANVLYIGGFYLRNENNTAVVLAK